MTVKQFFDWQTGGGTNDVMRLVDTLERLDFSWCAIGGVAVSHWAGAPLVTPEFDFVVGPDQFGRAVWELEAAGFRTELLDSGLLLKGESLVRAHLWLKEMYREFPARSIAADFNGMLVRVAGLDDTLTGKIEAWFEADVPQSKHLKDLLDIVRLVERFPELWANLPRELQEQVHAPPAQAIIPSQSQ